MRTNSYIAHCQVSAAFSRCLQYTNFVLQGKNTANEAMEGMCEPDVVAPKAHQNNCSYGSSADLPSDSLCKNLAWWVVTWRTSKNKKLSKLGVGHLCGYGCLPRTIHYLQRKRAGDIYYHVPDPTKLSESLVTFANITLLSCFGIS